MFVDLPKAAIHIVLVSCGITVMAVLVMGPVKLKLNYITNFTSAQILLAHLKKSTDLQTVAILTLCMFLCLRFVFWNELP